MHPSPEKIFPNLISALPVLNHTDRDIDFNERFTWDAATDMKNSYKSALKRGLPYPILTVAEYFSLGREGFSWGGQYRAAGYYASILLWSSLASWFLMNLLLIAVPRYGAYMKCLTGALLVCTNIGYFFMLPKRPLVIHIEGGKLEFSFGWCYWLLLVAGCISDPVIPDCSPLTSIILSGVLCLFVGLVISAIDLVYPHTFSTVLEVYYDTPYDRHVILEESRDVRYRKRNSKGLEDPTSLGSRILRRLSSKTKDTTGGPSGVDNKGYQSDVPKSPWRYPFRRVQNLPHPLQRTISQDSTSSIASAVQIAPMHKQALSRILP